MPVETEIANRLETGWSEVRAWTEEWEIELASAVEVGLEGEEKVRWQLWDPSSLSPPNSRPTSRAGPTEAMTQLQGNTMPATVSKTATGEILNDGPSKVKPNEWDWVLFANRRDAYICRDTMLSFGNKRPLANIRKGRPVGTHVVRGFSEEAWLRLHPSKKRSSNTRKRSASYTPQPTLKNTKMAEKDRRSSATASLRVQSSSSQFQAGGNVGEYVQQQEGLGVGENEEERGKVTDLFLVVHG